MTEFIRTGPGGAGRHTAGPASGRLPPPPTPVQTGAKGQPLTAGDPMPYGLRIASGYAWRLIVIAVAVYLIFVVVAQLTFVAVAVFVALVISALLRPSVDRVAVALPRGLAVVAVLLLTIIAFAGVFTFITNSVTGQLPSLTAKFANGLSEIERSLAGAPLHLRTVDLTQAGQQVRDWVTQNGDSLAANAISGAGFALEALSGFALAVFCSIFFLSSGDRIWTWLLTQAGGDRRRWDGAARAGWATFASYTRGVVIIAASNATLVCLALLILRVPLALPLALLVFFAAFVPLIGSPVALAMAALVALAARGPVTALLVVALVVVIGQIEGHLLHPMVMSRAVNLHPLAVALAVTSGTVLAGVIGAVVAVPLVAVAWTIWTDLRA